MLEPIKPVEGGVTGPEQQPVVPQIDAVQEGVPLTAELEAVLDGEIPARRSPGARARRPGYRSQRHEQLHRKSPEELIREQAQQFYYRASAELYEAVYSDETTSPDPATGVDKLKSVEQWSYAAYARETTRDEYGFIYGSADIAAQGSKGRRGMRPDKKITPAQTAEDHTQARLAFVHLMTGRFSEDQSRVASVLNKLQEAAAASGQADVFLKTTIKKHPKDPGAPLTQRLEGWRTGLENQRWLAVMDAVDWFGAQVADAEATVTQITSKKVGTTLPERLAQLDRNPNFKAMMTELGEDIKAFQALRELSIDVPQGDKIKNRIINQVKRAEWVMAKLQRQIGDMKKIAEPGRSSGLDKITEKKRDVESILFAMGPKFVQEADKNTEGLSPDQEDNFWLAMLELFEEVAPYQEAERRPRAGETQKELDIKRLGLLNAALHIYEKRRVGTKPDGKPDVQAFLTAGDVRSDIDQPQNFPELVAKARLDAQLLGDLRTMMRKTFAIMGKNFDRAVRVALKGHPNAEKIQMVEQLNDALSKKQNEANRALASDETVKAAQDKATAEGRKLQWKNAADQAAIKLIRTKTYELLGVGPEGKINPDAVKPLLVVVSPDEAAGQKAVEDERHEAVPLLETIAAFGDKAFDKNETATFARDIVKRLRKVIPDSVARQALVTALASHEPVAEQRTHEADQNKYLLVVAKVMLDCERFKSLLGKDWMTDLGLMKKIGQTVEVDMERLIQGVQEVEDEVYFAEEIFAFASASAESREVILNKIRPELKAQLAALDINDETVVGLMYCALPEGDAIGLPVNLNRAMEKLISYLGLESATKKGYDLLNNLGLAEKISVGDTEVVQLIPDGVKTIFKENKS